MEKIQTLYTKPFQSHLQGQDGPSVKLRMCCVVVELGLAEYICGVPVTPWFGESSLRHPLPLLGCAQKIEGSFYTSSRIRPGIGIDGADSETNISAQRTPVSINLTFESTCQFFSHTSHKNVTFHDACRMTSLEWSVVLRSVFPKIWTSGHAR